MFIILSTILHTTFLINENISDHNVDIEISKCKANAHMGIKPLVSSSLNQYFALTKVTRPDTDGLPQGLLPIPQPLVSTSVLGIHLFWVLLLFLLLHRSSTRELNKPLMALPSESSFLVHWCPKCKLENLKITNSKLQQ